MVRESHKKPWRMGWGFKNGKLSVFGARDIVVLRGWPTPMAWRRTRTKPWQATRKYADPLFRQALAWHGIFYHGGLQLEPDSLLDDLSGWKPGERLPDDIYYHAKVAPRIKDIATRFFDSTPENVLAELARHTDRHWHLYCLFARCPDCVELAKDHPVLAYALSSCWVFHKPEPSKPMRAVRSVLRKPVPAIWEWLGFPVDPISLGMYDWLEPRGLTIKGLLDYRKAVKNPATKRLLFDLGPLDWECLELIITPWMGRMISADLVRNIAHSNAWDLHWAAQVKEALIYLRMIEKEYEIPPLPSFEQVSQVVELRTHFETMTNGGFLMRRSI